MTPEQEAEYHRTYLPAKSPSHGTLASYSRFVNSLRNAYRIIGANLQSIHIVPKRDQRFEDFATPWELLWSALVPHHPDGSFTPIVDENLTVVGHYGSVGADIFSNLIVPEGAVGHRLSEGGTYFRAPYIYQILDEGIPVFVHSRKRDVPAGWTRFHAGIAETRQDAITTVDGEVLNVSVESAGFLEEGLSPADLLAAARILVTLGRKLGTTAVKALMRRSAKSSTRSVLDGPTQKLAQKALPPGPPPPKALPPGSPPPKLLPPGPPLPRRKPRAFRDLMTPLTDEIAEKLPGGRVATLVKNRATGQRVVRDQISGQRVVVVNPPANPEIPSINQAIELIKDARELWRAGKLSQEAIDLIENELYPLLHHMRPGIGREIGTRFIPGR